MEGPKMDRLNEADVKNITSTWKVVQGIGLQEAGLILFKRLFEQAPSLKEKFKFFKETPEISDDNVHLRKHALTVMETVNVAVGKLEEGALKDLSEDLVDVGAAHHVHNISQKDFEPVGEALLFALGAALGEKFTPEVKNSWLKLYVVVQLGMTPGIEKGMDGQPINLE